MTDIFNFHLLHSENAIIGTSVKKLKKRDKGINVEKTNAKRKM